ncbi:unnamed protein product [Trifolium pratense]|uniref:Uncharacterized protein n=1 Tax=Trifolium pratense TaxID=57577 RepID=A0ACB0JZC3_TRIPR|nr:unnamed protein product [Trifolium pratense]
MGKNRVGDEIQNKQIIFRDYVIGYTQEADLYISTIKLQVPQGSNAVLVKNMYLSCDPTMQFLMRKDESPLSGSYKYIPGSPIYGFGVAKILDSGHPSFIAEWRMCLHCWVVMLLEVLVVKRKYFPEGIDFYFEQVGGKMLDAVLLNMKVHGRIAICGMISQYNIPHPEALKNLLHIALHTRDLL